MASDRMSAGDAPQARVFATADALASEVADWIVARAQQQSRRFALCLSGGETPKRLYERLAAPSRRDRFPWDRAHFFWGDERAVPRGDPRSNFRAAWEALLQHAPVPPGHIHAIPTEQRSAAAGAAEYEAMLKRFYGADTLVPGQPLFDLTLLGLGADGHIASLFPGSPALAETERWVVPAVGADGLDRITLTYPALESSAATAFLFVGECKRDVLARALDGDPTLPVTRLRPAGPVYWFADRAAAALPALSGE
jgi:6-phosphogluconolactonase